MKLVGERRALSAVVFAFWFLMYLLNAVMGPPQLANVFYGFAGVYGLAFFSLVAGYFWARWYSVGVGLFGIILGAVGLWQIGPDEQILFIGGTHLLAVGCLWGSAMAEGYDGQTAWREKLHMDEHAVQRLGRSVIRAGVSLPFVLLYAFAPRTGGTEAIVALAALALAGLGFRALIRLRTWGVLAIGAAGGLMLAMAGLELAQQHHEMLVLRPALAGALLVLAAMPWLRPALRFMRG
jgi:hypothetical protein